jgi:hypothetical protein
MLYFLSNISVKQLKGNIFVLLQAKKFEFSQICIIILQLCFIAFLKPKNGSYRQLG